MEELIEEKS